MKDTNRKDLSVGDLVWVPYWGFGILLSIREGQALIHIASKGEIVYRHPSDLEVINESR